MSSPSQETGTPKNVQPLPGNRNPQTRTLRHIDSHRRRGFIIDQLKRGRGAVARLLGYGHIISANLAVAAGKAVEVAFANDLCLVQNVALSRDGNKSKTTTKNASS